MLKREEIELHNKTEKIVKISWINMKIVEVEWSKQIIIFCPWFPESNWFNDQIIKHISETYNTSCIYPQYSGTWDSDWEFLAIDPTEDIKKVIQYIRSWKLWENKDAHITLIGSSFGGGVALGLSRNEDVWNIIALSPLTNSSWSVDRDWLFDYVANNRPNDYRINEIGYEKLKNGKLLNIPNKYPEKKVIVWAVKWDNEIDFEKLTTESLKKNADLINDIILSEGEKKHLSWSVINRSTESTKNQIFNSLDIINERIEFIDLFIKSVLEVKSEEDIYWILSHWSWIFNNWEPRDFDFIIVLNAIQPNDFEMLTNIKNKFLAQWIDNLDITLIYKDKLDIGWVENFNLSTHGNYYSEIIANAKTLYWENPFTSDSKKKIKKNRYYTMI